MSDMVAKVRLFILFLLFVSIVILWVMLNAGRGDVRDYLLIHFLDVGQGDAIFIQTPNGIDVLIDGGPDNSVLRGLSKHMPFFDRNIDMVVGTHPDTDHIGGLIDVLDRYYVSNILTTNNEGRSIAASVYKQSVKNENASVVIARHGQVFQLDEDIFLEVLFPMYDTKGLESNTSSIILKLVHGDIEVLFMGDSPKRIEKFLVRQEIDLDSDVLKVGHHGSLTSTSEVFLYAVSPQYAVISVGQDSRHGHPHAEVVERLISHGVQIYKTGKEDGVTFVSDSMKVWRE